MFGQHDNRVDFEWALVSRPPKRAPQHIDVIEKDGRPAVR
jgi:hypothetical protein